MVFAVMASVCLMTASLGCCKTAATLLWLGAALGIQLRLVCNLIDGMVAIEGGMKSPVGGLYNEVPDRIADPLLLIAAGYCNEWVVKALGHPAGLGGRGALRDDGLHPGAGRHADRHPEFHRADGEAAPHGRADRSPALEASSKSGCATMANPPRK